MNAYKCIYFKRVPELIKDVPSKSTRSQTASEHNFPQLHLHPDSWFILSTFHLLRTVLSTCWKLSLVCGERAVVTMEAIKGIASTNIYQFSIGNSTDLCFLLVPSPSKCLIKVTIHQQKSLLHVTCKSDFSLWIHIRYVDIISTSIGTLRR